MALKRPALHVLSLPTSIRNLHRLNSPTLRIPKPTPFVPDVPTFLTLIGRGLSAQAAKIPSWDALFSLTSEQLKDAGVEPARARRYLLWWRERFRNGIHGIGGDMKEVKDGVAELRIVEVQSNAKMDQAATLTKSQGMRKIIVNTPPTVSLPPDPANPASEPDDGSITPPPVLPKGLTAQTAQKLDGLKIVQGSLVGGRGVEYVKGHPGVARLKVQEGLWENRRGHKVDGGERRKAEVRYKRAAAEKKNAR